MTNESGTWIMYGADENDPACLHTVEEAIEYINKVGFLPLFKNDIPGFSLEERTVSDYWWSKDLLRDPWEWREIIARSSNVAYGKFFDKKAGFISKEWFPYFANYRRDGYDFDALWEDEKATMRQKKIMDLFEDDKSEWYSFEVKQKAGFGKDGEQNFEGTIANLQMQTYLCIHDFRQRKNKSGIGYGMDVAVYSTPEHLWGYEYITSAYAEDPMESAKRIAKHMMNIYPTASAEQIRKVIGAGLGENVQKKKKEKQVDYPANLIKDLKLDIKAPTADQLYGLEFALGQLKESYQEVIRMRYKKGLTYKQISEQAGRSSGRCSQMCRKGLLWLRRPERISWIMEGYEGRIARVNKLAEEAKKQFIADGKTESAMLMDQSPDALPGITANFAKFLMKVGITNLGTLREALKSDFWTHGVPGIGDESGKKIVYAMYRAGLIDEGFEAYKEASSREYMRAKCMRMREEVVEEE